MEILELLRKAQTSHNDFADAYQNIAQVLPSLKARLEEQEKIIKEMKEKASSQKSLIESFKIKNQLSHKGIKRVVESQEPFSLIEIFCRKAKEEVQLGYEIKTRKANEKHRKVDKERISHDIKTKNPLKPSKSSGGKSQKLNPCNKSRQPKSSKTIKDFNKNPIQLSQTTTQDLPHNK